MLYMQHAKVLGQRALETFHAYAPDFVSFGKIFGLEGIEKIVELNLTASKAALSEVAGHTQSVLSVKDVQELLLVLELLCLDMEAQI